jgi:hypothetical protein
MLVRGRHLITRQGWAVLAVCEGTAENTGQHQHQAPSTPIASTAARTPSPPATTVANSGTRMHLCVRLLLLNILNSSNSVHVTWCERTASNCDTSNPSPHNSRPCQSHWRVPRCSQAPPASAHLKQALLVSAIPDADHAVAAASGKSAVGCVEGDRVYGVHLCDPCGLVLLAVALWTKGWGGVGDVEGVCHMQAGVV